MARDFGPKCCGQAHQFESLSTRLERVARCVLAVCAGKCEIFACLAVLAFEIVELILDLAKQVTDETLGLFVSRCHIFPPAGHALRLTLYVLCDGGVPMPLRVTPLASRGEETDHCRSVRFARCFVRRQ